MTQQRPELTHRQKVMRGVVFVSAGIFIVLQFAAGTNPPFIINVISWIAAMVSFGTMLVFMWDIRRTPRQ